MNHYKNCIAHNSSEGQLLIGDTAAALVDCGMVFCVEETIANVRNALDGRDLGYILMTHTHYDHIGALPYFRERWPEVKAVTTETGAAVLLKDTPRRMFRELSTAAAIRLGNADVSSIVSGALLFDYNDDAFCADMTVKDGDSIDLGGISVTVLETPGHTRDSLSFFVPESGLLLLCETPGVLMPDGEVYPCFLTSYTDTLDSIAKCRRTGYKTLAFPHRGILPESEVADFFDRAEAANRECREFILNLKGVSEEALLEAFFKRYASDHLMTYQPKEAFFANARATIGCTVA
jgi:glyoxylase-like metal-dependent hydrolase (beta-lactamase superfamily II)